MCNFFVEKYATFVKNGCPRFFHIQIFCYGVSDTAFNLYGVSEVKTATNGCKIGIIIP